MQRNILCAFVITVCCCQCAPSPTDAGDRTADLMIPERFEASVEPIQPIAAEQDLPAAIVALGRKLYHDTQLSGTQKLSCATCHPVDGPGMVPAIIAPLRNSRGSRSPSRYNVPTIFNVGEHFAYFWNGRAQSLEKVIQISIQAENIMDGTWRIILERLASDPGYSNEVANAYPDTGLTEENVVNALATYLRSLTTPNAAFDRWLNGENLSENAKEGYRLFKSYGCIRCHQGAGVGGNMYASFRSYLESREPQRNTDYGRYNVTKDEAHRYQFKVPSLRNVAVTAPYFHDGSAISLSDAVEAMAQHQLGRSLTRTENNQIVSFLESLTGWRENALLSESP
ncbi:MAG: c-type cytochrome [Candidatus Hydrogenedentes bacterium]|nr:c-type cytochrome [Candidatus Hydrogenedentota bacterium]